MWKTRCSAKRWIFSARCSNGGQKFDLERPGAIRAFCFLGMLRALRFWLPGASRVLTYVLYAPRALLPDRPKSLRAEGYCIKARSDPGLFFSGSPGAPVRGNSSGPTSLKNGPKTGQKRPGIGAVFFALLPPFWYGFRLESWGPVGLSQTQEKRAFSEPCGTGKQIS